MNPGNLRFDVKAASDGSANTKTFAANTSVNCLCRRKERVAADGRYKRIVAHRIVLCHAIVVVTQSCHVADSRCCLWSDPNVDPNQAEVQRSEAFLRRAGHFLSFGCATPICGDDRCEA